MSTSEIQMPTSTIKAYAGARTIHELYLRLSEFLEDEAKVRSIYFWADRFVMGLPLAPWQREFVWDQDQMSRFITSVWMDIDLGSYLVNNPEENLYMDERGQLRAAPLADCVMDGQQRLHALQCWFTDGLAVSCSQGQPRYWSQIPIKERRRFLSTVFTRAEVCSNDERQLREIYDLRAFGGVPHREHERAQSHFLPKPRSGP